MFAEKKKGNHSLNANDEESEFTARSGTDAPRNTGPSVSPVVSVPGATAGKENITLDVLLSKPEVMLDQMRFLRMYLEASTGIDPAEEIRAVMKKRGRLTLQGELPQDERKGYNPVTKSIFSIEKLSALGWKARSNIRQGLESTISEVKTRNME